jgi:hypothetical protein
MALAEMEPCDDLAATDPCPICGLGTMRYGRDIRGIECDNPVCNFQCRIDLS